MYSIHKNHGKGRILIFFTCLFRISNIYGRYICTSVQKYVQYSIILCPFIIVGEGIPSNCVGRRNSVYIDSTTNYYYYKKSEKNRAIRTIGTIRKIRKGIIIGIVTGIPLL